MQNIFTAKPILWATLNFTSMEELEASTSDDIEGVKKLLSDAVQDQYHILVTKEYVSSSSENLSFIELKCLSPVSDMKLTFEQIEELLDRAK